MTAKQHPLLMLMISLGIILVGILILNNWITKEVNYVEQPAPAPKLKPGTIYIPARPKPQPVVIDSLNDPLAPVVKKVSEPTTTINKASPKKAYEAPLSEPILVQ